MLEIRNKAEAKSQVSTLLPQLNSKVDAQLLLISGYRSIGQPKVAVLIAKRTIELPLAQWDPDKYRLFEVLNHTGETAAALKVVKQSKTSKARRSDLIPSFGRLPTNLDII